MDRSGEIIKAQSRGEICGSLSFIIGGDAYMQRMNIKCCHCGDYTSFITEENIEVIPQVNLTRTDMDILGDIADTLAECGYSDMCGFLH